MFGIVRCGPELVSAPKSTNPDWLAIPPDTCDDGKLIEVKLETISAEELDVCWYEGASFFALFRRQSIYWSFLGLGGPWTRGHGSDKLWPLAGLRTQE